MYQTSTTFNGAVWQYGLPLFDNYTFQASTKSTRFMFDLKPYVWAWRSVIPYGIFGMGATLNTLSYHEQVAQTDIAEDSALYLSKNSTTHLAWDAGLGILFELTSRLNITAEYIYAYLYHANPAKETTVHLMSPPSFLLQNQTFLFGLNLKL